MSNSKAPQDELKDAIEKYTNYLREINALVPAYVNFMSVCYTGLTAMGVPPPVACQLTAEALRLHIQEWGRQSTNNTQSGNDLLQTLLANAHLPKGGH